MTVLGNFYNGFKNALGEVFGFKPAEHTHSMDEIEDLHVDEIASNHDEGEDYSFVRAVRTTVSGIKHSVSMKFDRLVFTLKGNNPRSITVNSSNFSNLERALNNPDSTPTADSNNLVTSGGVKTELDKKIDSSLIQNLEIIENEQEGSIEISFERITLNLDNYLEPITLVNIKYGSQYQIGVPTCGGILLCRNANLLTGNEQHIYIGKYVYHRTYEADLQHRGWSNWTKNELYS